MATIDVAGLNRQGKVFTIAVVSELTFTAVGTGLTGLILYNPPGSGIKAVIIDMGFSWTTVPATGTQGVCIAVGAPQSGAIPTTTGTAALSATFGQAADGSANRSKVVPFASATIAVANTARRWGALGAGFSTSVSIGPYMGLDRVDGSVILVPGATAAICGITNTVLGVGSFTWAELPV
jgi:hypothetical protein